MHTEPARLFPWMTVFFIAMAFLESAVVVYLRALYYPDGFELTLVAMDPLLVRTEVLRELATMIMLLAPGALVSRSAIHRFAWFCFGFGVWDIFYYVWLKVLLDWPASFATPDLLFLIPVPWVGPVWAPCLISAGLIVLAVLLLRRSERDGRLELGALTWSILICGACCMVVSFILVPLSRTIHTGHLMEGEASDANEAALSADYPWPWLLGGMMLAAIGLWRIGKGTFKVP